MSDPTTLVTLNSFQGPSCDKELLARLEKWMLKQVQHDGDFYE